MKQVNLDDCWLFAKSLSPKGYGLIYKNNDPSQYAHRVMYENMVGPIPEGFVTDHLCRITRCINPDHLEPVTPKENLYRGFAPSSLNRFKTHCPFGHPLSGDNLYIQKSKNGKVQRRCKGCMYPRMRKYYAEARIRKAFSDV